MKKIACVGYHGTGAGVIDDLFRECDNVSQGTYEAEIKLLHESDGISDLEYHLVECPHRTSSSLAIKRFIKYAKDNERQYVKAVGSQWLDLAKKYAIGLVKVDYLGYNKGDRQFLSLPQRLFYLGRRAFNKCLPKALRKPAYYNYFPKMHTYYSLLDEREFLNKTVQFINQLCELINKDNKEYVMLDQAIGVDNPARYLRYIDDVKVIIVDRDPRDLYINHTKAGDHVLPKDPYDFCVVYRNIRKVYGVVPTDKVLYVNFADMIYKYDEYVKKVLDFVGIEKKHHVSPKTYFIPDVSLGGTQMWKSYPQYMNAVKIIEKELPEFLYNYPEQY